MSLKVRTFPRAAIIGNPSDGYFGKTLSCTFMDFHAEVQLEDNDRIIIEPGPRDIPQYDDSRDFSEKFSIYGYYGGIRLIKAGIKVFLDHYQLHRGTLPDKGFKLSYSSNIPDRLGLAGSSAIVTGVLMALCRHHSFDMPKEIIANLAVSAERDELGIMAGLQDRVAQVYYSPVFMDFNEQQMRKFGYGKYSDVNAKDLPPIYIAYKRKLSEGSEVTHNFFRQQYDQRDVQARLAVREWIRLADQFMLAIKEGDIEQMSYLIDLNFNIRAASMAISPAHKELVETIRKAGVSAKFTGSGGAVLGIYKGEEELSRLQSVCEEEEIELLLPEICSSPEIA